MRLRFSMRRLHTFTHWKRALSDLGGMTTLAVLCSTTFSHSLGPQAPKTNLDEEMTHKISNSLNYSHITVTGLGIHCLLGLGTEQNSGTGTGLGLASLATNHLSTATDTRKFKTWNRTLSFEQQVTICCVSEIRRGYRYQFLRNKSRKWRRWEVRRRAT
jgi:hypothetical protein